jgi:hypothetical protein
MLKNSGYADDYMNYYQSLWELSRLQHFVCSSKGSSCEVRRGLGSIAQCLSIHITNGNECAVRDE